MADPAANHQWRLAARPSGALKDTDLEFVTAERPEPGDGQALVAVRYLSMDPTIRGWMERDTYRPAIPVGEVVDGFGVGEIVESDTEAYPLGAMVSGLTGWQEFTLADSGQRRMQVLPEGVAPEMALALFGPSGLAAYFGMLRVGRPEEGDTVLVSGAAGATGSVAGQIAKLRGARVIGTAGSADKCRFLTDELGFDAAVDYRAEDVEARLGALAPEGIDVFFDNVGGPVLDAALLRLAAGARIALCGAISDYDTAERWGPTNYLMLVLRSARMQGFLVFDYRSEWPAAIEQLAAWAGDGRIRQELDVVDGIEHTRAAFKRLFTGGNRGKNLVRV